MTVCVSFAFYLALKIIFFMLFGDKLLFWMLIKQALQMYFPVSLKIPKCQEKHTVFSKSELNWMPKDLKSFHNVA